MKIGGFRSAQGRAVYERAYAVAMAELPPGSTARDVETAFGSVRAYVWAGERQDASPVVLLPGRSSGVPMWAENLPSLLATGRTVVAFDAIGDAGMSVQSAPLRTAADQARWVEEALSGLGLHRVHTVGHSFGGATAAAHARRYPDRPASLTLLEPVLVLRPLPAAILFWTLVASLPLPSSWRDHALAAIGGVSVDDVRARSPIGDMIAAGSQHFAAALPVPKVFSDDELAVLTMPVYVAIADHSSLAGGATAARRARTLPEPVVEVWPDTTHSLPMQAGAALAHRLADFWDAAEGGANGSGRPVG